MITIQVVLFWFLATAALTGALVVLSTKDVMHLIIGLGTTLLALAGFFALFGLGFLAVAEIFLYVGGVLVVFLFAIMLAHRGREGAPDLETRHALAPAAISAGVFLVLVLAFWSLVPRGIPSALPGSVESLATALLTRLLPQFELAGVLLLAGLAAVVALVGGERR